MGKEERVTKQRRRNNEKKGKHERLGDSVFLALKMKYNTVSLQILPNGRVIYSPPYFPELYNATEILTSSQ